MAVNLSTSDPKEDNQVVVSGGALNGIAIVLFLVLLTWVGLFFYKRYLDKAILETKTSYEGYLVELSKGDSPKVIDFQRRLDVSKSLISTGRNMQEDFVKIESLTVPKAYLATYFYDDSKKKITLSYVGDNFNTIAKQILSMKNSDYFSSVVAGASSVDSKTNIISFNIELSFAPELKN